MEVDLQLVEQQTGQCAQTQAEYDLHQRLQEDADGVDAALLQRVCDAERGRKEHQTHGIINGDHHQQQAGQGPLALYCLTTIRVAAGAVAEAMAPSVMADAIEMISGRAKCRATRAISTSTVVITACRMPQ